MTREELKQRNMAMREYKSQGHTNKEVAEKFGLHQDTAKVICKGISPQYGRRRKTSDKLHTKTRKDERYLKALELIKCGHTAQEIKEMLNYKSIGSVYSLASTHGLKLRKAHDTLHDEMRKYKAEGHTMSEVAEKYGVCKGTAQQICKGIAIQKARPPKDGYKAANKGILQDINNVIRIINERAPDFEYAGNYTGSDGHVDLRCKKCGHIRRANWNTLRHKGIKTCPNCLEIAKQKHEAEVKKLSEAEKLRKECDKRGKEVVRLLTRAIKLHRCPVCGTVTDNKLYCSSKCSAKAYETKKDANRRKRITNALIDKDISLEALYKRDNGICHICGGKCDWGDHKYKGRYFIVGKKYPSIDHVIPLSKGGTHSWDNVKLAHLSCNSAKGASLVG